MVCRDDDPEGVAFGSLETIGWGGALLRCDEAIPPSTDAELAICLAGGVIRARARVLYHLEDEHGLGIGLEFLEIPGDSGDLLEHLVSSPGYPALTHRLFTPNRWPFLLFEPAAPPEASSETAG